jgi:hypothetical protein
MPAAPDDVPVPTPMTPEERAAALARAEAYGIDLSLLRRRLVLTPEQRFREIAQAARAIVQLRAGIAR